MKFCPTQFGVRENTASPRQHAPRFAVEGPVLKSNLLTATQRPDKGTHELVPGINETFELSITEPIKGTTGGDPGLGTTRATEYPGQSGIERPLTCEEAADLVRVHPKTIKRMARDRRLPGHFRFGRWFFFASELDGWMRTELNSSRHSCRWNRLRRSHHVPASAISVRLFTSKTSQEEAGRLGLGAKRYWPGWKAQERDCDCRNRRTISHRGPSMASG